MVTRSFILGTALICAGGNAAARIDTIYCEPRDTLRHLLQSEHGAQLAGQGVRGPDVILEIWTAPDSGDWTLVQTYANGQACIVAMGGSWEALPIGPDNS